MRDLLICNHFSGLADYLLMVLQGKTVTFTFFFLNSTEKELNWADKGKGQMLHFKCVTEKASEALPLREHTLVCFLQ